MNHPLQATPPPTLSYLLEFYIPPSQKQTAPHLLELFIDLLRKHRERAGVQAFQFFVLYCPSGTRPGSVLFARIHRAVFSPCKIFPQISFLLVNKRFSTEGFCDRLRKISATSLRWKVLLFKAGCVSMGVRVVTTMQSEMCALFKSQIFGRSLFKLEN